MEVENKVYNEDCLIGMQRYPDKYFDLAIVDPPYGLGKRTTSGGKNKSKGGKNYQACKWENHNWDNEIPKDEYFIELFRISKKQIVWGGNYFPFLWKSGCRGLITWDKMVYLPTMSQIEYAWYSDDCLPKLIKIDNNQINRQHPTQKPIKLYKWLLENYANQGDKILDTHLGSGSSRIACYDYKFEFVGFELDTDYYNAQEIRFNNHIQQLSLF